ncbi:MAG: NTP transferase domain-containing protein [Firmicutes bacterium]|nr:NTP transferase domain-containing protein [Bacillota bacterium]
MKAVIMAGGQGTRLRPLTCDIPKPMVPVANRPMMEYILRLLYHHELRDIVITTCYLPESIEDYFGDGAPWGTRLRYYAEDRPLGTAGSVKNASAYLNETFLVISGDCLTDFDLRAAIAYHREKQALVTLVLTRVTSPLEYGVVFINRAGQVERFLEKPSWGEVFSDTVNTGIYILEPEVLAQIPADTRFDFSRDLFPLLLENQEPLYGYVAEGYWSDIGGLEQYTESQVDILTGKIRASIPGSSKDGIWIERGAWVHSDAVLEPPVVLGKNSRVEKGATVGPYSVLGQGTIVGQHSSVRRSVLWQNVHVGTGAEIRGAVICDQVVIKPRARVFEGVVIGRNSILGMSSTVRPHIKVWPHKVIERKSVVNDNVVWGGTCSKALFGNTGIVGIANMEISPEFATRVGASLGALQEQGHSVLVAADGWGASRMVKRALTTGLLSTGVNVVDIGSTTLPVARFTTVLTTCAAGVYVRQGRQIPDQVEIQVMDEAGFPLHRSQERAIENYFSRGDFRRVQGNAVGRTQFAAGANQAYLKALVQKYGKSLPAGGALAVVVGYTSPALSSLVPTLLTQLGCQVIDLDFDKEPGAAPSGIMHEREAYLSELSEAVLENGAVLGLLLDGSGEAGIITDDEGKPLPEERYWPLLTWALAASGEDGGGHWAVPVTASHTVDHIAEKYRGSVLRTPNNTRALLQAVGKKAKEDLALLHPAFDVLSFVATLLGLMVRERKQLVDLTATLPSPGRKQVEVPCDWQDKGKVMHSLLESTAERERDLVDGIKVFHDEGWALVLPDGEEPLIRVYAEAATEDEADALVHLYMSQINDISDMGNTQLT